MGTTHPFMVEGATVGKALASLLAQRAGTSMTSDLAKQFAELADTVDRFYAANTGTTTISFTGESLTADFPGNAPDVTILCVFNIRRAISLTEELITSNGTQWVLAG